ncbi:uncharacterized protein LOC120165267 [Hibiscus syriacus]|uniref:uncharacterized protein LOC120165267 n=1 Tax=Hibiscus syriacus TaxID=106335 RepID=UPI00192440CF|nr:uncharacterized protein LOC120165267 [Hibiscus syriacus]
MVWSHKGKSWLSRSLLAETRSPVTLRSFLFCHYVESCMKEERRLDAHMVRGGTRVVSRTSYALKMGLSDGLETPETLHALHWRMVWPLKESWSNQVHQIKPDLTAWRFDGIS